MVKVIELWEPGTEKIAQTGLPGDPSGVIKFTAWSSADLTPMTEGSCYLIQSAVTGVYNERFQVNLNI